MADLLAKEPKDCDFHRMQTRYQVPDLTGNSQTDALNSFQHLKHPPQGRTTRRLVDMIRDGRVLTGQGSAQTTLCHGIDQQRQGHHHQQALKAAEPALRLGLALGAGDHFGIAELLRFDVSPQHKTRFMLLGLLYVSHVSAGPITWLTRFSRDFFPSAFPAALPAAVLAAATIGPSR